MVELLECQSEEEMMEFFIKNYNEVKLFNVSKKLDRYEDEYEEEVLELLKNSKKRFLEELESIHDFQKGFSFFKLQDKVQELQRVVTKIGNMIITPYKEL